MKLEHSLTPYTKINPKQIKDVNVRPDTINFLEEYVGIFDINRGNIFLVCLQSNGNKNKNKWDLSLILKSFCKENHKQNKKTSYRMGKNICKQGNQEGINPQNTQKVCTAFNNKVCRTKYLFHQTYRWAKQSTWKKMFNIAIREI